MLLSVNRSVRARLKVGYAVGGHYQSLLLETWSKCFQRRHKWDAATRHVRMKVQSRDVNFGKLAAGILLRAEGQLATDLDACGTEAASNAIKAVALANAFAAKDGHNVRVAFVPRMVREKGSLSNDQIKFLRLLLRYRTPIQGDELDLSKGGIYVPTAAFGAYGVDANEAAFKARVGLRGSPEREISDAYVPRRADTPFELSQKVMSRWLRYTSTASSPSDAKAVTSPFLVTQHPLALARAAKALAFVCSDLAEERLRKQAPGLVVEATFWTKPRNPVDQNSNGSGATGTKCVVLRLRPLDRPKDADAREVRTPRDT
eukprot:TRINITY_DN60087_c0_g1_i1.p1 TRINITY_DN60087_c0_g1~~TRINITY_DN60087_c0_g1_i1.p1  ORF type:complete len:317 (-),score=35.70 TRINITY_DN60087_c0_g1_i1:226-1176(-)